MLFKSFVQRLKKKSTPNDIGNTIKAFMGSEPRNLQKVHMKNVV